VTELRFLSPTQSAEGTTTSPLRRALDGTPVEDLSLSGVVELRGGVDSVSLGDGEELVRLSPRRAFLFTAGDPFETVARVRAEGVLAYDVTGALAGFAVEGEQLMRRLTDLDLTKLPAAGPFARVSALVVRDEGERFRVYVPQELGHDVSLAVLDVMAGLERGGQPQTGVRLKPDPSAA
jgi:hypothetical protein